MTDTTTPRDDAPLTGNEAITKAEEVAAATSGLNIPALEGLPIADDTANLRYGPDIHEGLLALLPLVGVWRGEGVGNYPEATPSEEEAKNEQGDFAFGQQLIVSHNGENYLCWDSRTWRLDGDGSVTNPDVRETGFWRISEKDEIEVTYTSSTGVVEIFYGEPFNDRAWQLESASTMVTETGPKNLGPGKRMYGLMPNNNLGWVDERMVDGEMRPYMSAELTRIAG